MRPLALTPIRFTVLALLWADVIFKLGYFGLWLPIHAPDCDYWKHWDAARNLLHGLSPYYGHLDRSYGHTYGNLFLGFNYPLFTGYIYLWLGWLSAPASEVAWEICNLLYSIGGALLAWRYMRPEAAPPTPGESQLSQIVRGAVRQHWLTASFVMTANFHPLLLSFMPGNIDPLNFFLMMCLGAALVRRAEFMAGVSIAALSLVKVVPVLLLLPAFAARRRRIVITAVGLLAFYLLVLLATGQWRTELFLYTDVLPRLGYHYLGISASLHRVLASLFYPRVMQAKELYGLWSFGVSFALLFIFALVCLAWALRRRRNYRDLFAFGMFMGILLSPLLEYHHFVWVAPVLYMQVRDWTTGRLPLRIALLCLVGWIALNFARIVNDFWAMLPVPTLYWTSGICIYLAVLAGWVAFSAPPDDAPATSSL